MRSRGNRNIPDTGSLQISASAVNETVNKTQSLVLRSLFTIHGPISSWQNTHPGLREPGSVCKGRRPQMLPTFKPTASIIFFYWFQREEGEWETERNFNDKRILDLLPPAGPLLGRSPQPGHVPYRELKEDLLLYKWTLNHSNNPAGLKATSCC